MQIESLACGIFSDKRIVRRDLTLCNSSTIYFSFLTRTACIEIAESPSLFYVHSSYPCTVVCVFALQFFSFKNENIIKI